MKITVDQSRVVKTRLAAGERICDLASEYGVHTETIRRIKRGSPRGRKSATRMRYAEPVLERYEINRAGCWIYTGTLDRVSGYGVTAEGPAHRVFYLAHGGVIPDGYQLDHLCRVRPCVNPRHLEAVTQQENLRRAGFGKHERRRDQSRSRQAA